MEKSKSNSGVVVFYQPENKKRIERRIRRNDLHFFSRLDNSQAELAIYPQRKIDWTLSDHEVSDWIDQAVSATISFGEIEAETKHSMTSRFPASFENLISHLQQAVTNYLEFKSNYDDAPPPSEGSAKSFLFLVPALAPYEPDISIDSTNGCINLSIHSRKSGILTSQISPEGKVYYSFAGRGDRVFKITGTAKFKTARDHLQFRRVLNLL